MRRFLNFTRSGWGVFGFWMPAWGVVAGALYWAEISLWWAFLLCPVQSVPYRVLGMMGRREAKLRAAARELRVR